MRSTALDRAIGSLRLSRRRRRRIAQELYDHVEDVQLELQACGWNAEAAERESLARLGDMNDIVEGFGDAYRPARARQVGLACGLAAALLVGGYGIGGNLASATSVHHTAPAVAHAKAHLKHCSHQDR